MNSSKMLITMLFEVIVKLKARKNELIVDTNNKTIVFKTNQIPEKNKINLSLVKMLAKHFNVSVQDIKIKRGLKSRKKLVEITV